MYIKVRKKRSQSNRQNAANKETPQSKPNREQIVLLRRRIRHFWRMIYANEIPLPTYIKASSEDVTDDMIPMNDLIDLHKKYRDSHGTAISILRSTSAIISVMSSSTFIWMIMRSHERLSTTQHRLLLGLCIFDITFSLSLSTFNFTVPSDNDYWIWNARGNEATCDAQGFMSILGACGGLLYNVSLNLFFLALVKFKKNDEYIRTKIEPFLHSVPIVVALSSTIVLLVNDHYNNDIGGTCTWPVNDAPHCQGYNIGEMRKGFKVPCHRGNEGWQTTLIYRAVMTLIPVVIMMVSLGMIYRAVRTQEKKIARYGAGPIRAKVQQPREAAEKVTSGGRLRMSLTSLSTFLKSGLWPCKKPHKSATASNNKVSKSRAVMRIAFGYTFAWILSWGVYLIDQMISLATSKDLLVLVYAANMFVPLQGLFNLLIFMYPKIVAAKNKTKRGGETIPWCQAFAKAFWSRGKKGKRRGGSSKVYPKKTANGAADTMTRRSSKNGTS